MNTSIVNVLNNTTSPKVLAVAQFLMNNRNRKVEISFLKKDGSVRVMRFVPDGEYNRTFGIQSTQVGRRIVASKCASDMITVQEILEAGMVQPRTVNLRTVLFYKVA